MDNVLCPSCGRKIEIKPHPDRPWRGVGWCECHPAGAVIEMDLPPERQVKTRRETRSITESPEEAGHTHE